MLKAPIPDIMLNDIYELKAETLYGMGIKLLLLDLDNTLIPYGENRTPVVLRNWVDALKRAGVEPYILSNNRGTRPGYFAGDLSLEYTGSAAKPSTKKLLAILEEKGVPPEEAAIIGDQVYTDILCGKRAGILSIAVRPLKLRNPLLLLRYGLEYPFRRAGKKNKDILRLEL